MRELLCLPLNCSYFNQEYLLSQKLLMLYYLWVSQHSLSMTFLIDYLLFVIGTITCKITSTSLQDCQSSWKMDNTFSKKIEISFARLGFKYYGRYLECYGEIGAPMFPFKLYKIQLKMGLQALWLTPNFETLKLYNLSEEWSAFKGRGVKRAYSRMTLLYWLRIYPFLICLIRQDVTQKKAYLDD